MDAYETLHTALKVQEADIKCPKDLDETALRVAKIALCAKKKFQGAVNHKLQSDVMFGLLGMNDVVRLLDAYANNRPGEARDRAINYRLRAINDTLVSLGFKRIE